MGLFLFFFSFDCRSTSLGTIRESFVGDGYSRKKKSNRKRRAETKNQINIVNDLTSKPNGRVETTNGSRVYLGLDGLHGVDA